MAETRCVGFLRDYVAIPSVNPMQRTDIPPDIAGERRYAEHLREQLRRLKLDAELIGDPERPSVMAQASVADPIDTVLIASHLDTVPVDTMEIDPFDPKIEGGRLYGRGSCDTKGGMAALVDALERVLARGSLRRNLIIVGESDEEFGSIGARDVLAALGSRSPDWVLATEPTELRVATRHKGIAVARICATGTACHSSNPAAGRNAIVALSEAVLALDALAEEIAQRSDPDLGPPTLSVGVISGGMAANIVPDRAWLLMDRRMLPGETEEQVRSEIEMALARRELDSVEVETCRVEKPPLETPNDHPAVLACCAALSVVGVEPTTATVAFGTDAGVFAHAGLPGVVMGPGSIAQAHTAREFVPTREVETMADFFEALLEGRNVRNG